jgi:hypothetical protein
MTFGIGNTENRKQVEKRRLRHAKKLFELASLCLRALVTSGEYIRKKSVKDN